MTDFRVLISALAEARVNFIIVGGAAAVAHGSTRMTDDLDLVYQRKPENIEALVKALSPLRPFLRGVPEELPFRWESQTIRNRLNFTLTTAAGSIDLFGEIILGGTYDDLVPYSNYLELYGHKCLCLGLNRLIEVKRAAGRAKDFEVIAELELIKDEHNR
jgi:hypothetical protein